MNIPNILEAVKNFKNNNLDSFYIIRIVYISDGIAVKNKQLYLTDYNWHAVE